MCFIVILLTILQGKTKKYFSRDSGWGGVYQEGSVGEPEPDNSFCMPSNIFLTQFLYQNWKNAHP